MVTIRSALGGLGIAAGGCVATYLLTTYLDSTAGSGSVEYFNNVVRGATNILRPIGYLGSTGYGAWHAFLSDAARRPAPPVEPPAAGTTPRLRIVERYERDVDMR